MLTIATLSLSGGQGKTTISLFLAKYLVSAGYSVLMVDADPQHNSTTFLGHKVQPNEPTLLELIKGGVDWRDAVYPIKGIERLFLVPADDSLDQVQDFLSSSGIGALVLRQQLEPVAKAFDVCIIDPPPQRSQICKSVIVAASQILIPVEATVKGFGSLTRTIDAIAELKRAKVCQAEILGILPFRDKWVGNSQSLESRMCIDAMREEVSPELVLPSVRESEKFKKVISQGIVTTDLGSNDLAYPFDVLLEKIGVLTRKQEDVYV